MKEKLAKIGMNIAGVICKVSPVFFVVIFILLLSSAFSWASQSVDYLCELGVTYYKMGRYDDALSEFKKVLILEPENRIASSYINTIFVNESQPVPYAGQQPQYAGIPGPNLNNRSSEKEKAINKAFAQAGAMAGEQPKANPEKDEDGINLGGLKISGEAQARMGFSSGGDAIWKRANWDLNEYNWRMLSNNAFDNKENTYDPRIYDRLRVNLDTGRDEGFDFHGNITVDPWSFTGKSSKYTITSSGGDSADVEFKYWSNTGYTVNQTVNTTSMGNSISFPEVKVHDSKFGAYTVKGNFTLPAADVFTVPETKIYRQFQPVREMWVDYKQSNLKLRAYPIGYENQALSFDDPLRLSNNRKWWEDSPWIRAWQPGQLNTGVTPQDFTRGYWDNSLSSYTRDSEGQRLTALRGFSFDFNPSEETSFVTSVATPKTLWQDYSEVDNVISASRLKQRVADNLSLGLTGTTRFGFNNNNQSRPDARNYVGGVDASYEIIPGLQTNFEVAHSASMYDISNKEYRTKLSGNAYYVSIMGRFPFESIMDTKYGYEGIMPAKEEGDFTKFRLFASRMDESFDQPLSSYGETRDDEWWGRHMHFRKPFKYYYQGEGQMMTWDDIKNSRLGNGIDIGRSVLGLRIESLAFDKALSNLIDVRNVHSTDNKFVENVFRDELTWELTDKLTGKFLGIYHRLPKTKAGVDPYLFDPVTKTYYANSVIEDGKDPSVATGSLGANYDFTDWLSLNGIWEYTNDLSLGYDNFPRGVLNSQGLGTTYYQNGSKYRQNLISLYSQGYFPKPPYYYINVFKTGLSIRPANNLEFYLDYTRNPFEKAGQIDDNMNHIGLEMNYSPFKKLSMFFRYTYSRWQDLDKLISTGDTGLTGHNNFFAEFTYRQSEDQDFTFQYGEASRNPYNGGVLDIGWDPYGGSLRTIDTAHIFRMYYRKKF